MDFMGILVSFHPTNSFWKSKFIPSPCSKSWPKITSKLLFGLVLWNNAKIWAVKFYSGSIILTSASHDIKKDLSIMDHLFAEVLLVLNLFVRTMNREWSMHLHLYPSSFLRTLNRYVRHFVKCSYSKSYFYVFYPQELTHQMWWELNLPM